jgi:hypothetical protein
VVGAQFAVLGAADAFDGFARGHRGLGKGVLGAKGRAAAAASAMGGVGVEPVHLGEDAGAGLACLGSFGDYLKARPYGKVGGVPASSAGIWPVAAWPRMSCWSRAGGGGVGGGWA